MKRERPEQEEPASWLATFGDMATLLLTFYVLIYASCTYKPGQWETTRSALERVLSVMAGTSSTTLASSAGTGALGGENAAIPLYGVGEETEGDVTMLGQALKEAYEAASDERYWGNVEIEPSGGGLIFRISEPIAYRIGSADMTTSIEPLLSSVAKVIRAEPAEVVVEGHTCDLPIRSGRFESNWELSGARAAEAVRFLLSEGIGESSISARAWGEYRPLVPNEDESSRSRNRRVEIQVTFLDPSAK
jgi:chemotaxis protein MotB